MASPQIEDGYTKIANELLEAILTVNLSNYAFRVFMAILRKTYGFNKKTDWISLTQISVLTGIRTTHICRAVHELVNKNMLIKNGKVKGINKNYKQWKLPIQVVPIQVVPNEVILPNQVIKVTQSGNKKLPNQVVTKETTKETIQKKHISTTPIPIKEIIKLYNDTCLDLVKVKIISEKREDNIRYRWNKFAVKKDKTGNEIGIRLFEELFTMANESDFLSGRIEDKRGFKNQWKADFDWLLNETNMVKVLEGNYENRGKE